MNINTYIQKGAKEKEYLRLTGKSQMQIGRKLKEQFSGLTREEIAQKLIERYGELRGMAGDNMQAETQFVVHSFVLRPGRTAQLELPADLTPQEAEKLTKFIQILPSNAE